MTPIRIITVLFPPVIPAALLTGHLLAGFLLSTAYIVWWRFLEAEFQVKGQ